MPRTVSIIVFLVALVAASLAGVAAATAVTGGETAESSAMTQEAPSALLMAKGTARISATAGSASGEQWGVRVGATDTGGQCLDIGRVKNGVWGRPIPGSFVADASEMASGCGRPIGESPFWVNLAAAQAGGRNVIFGIADAAVTSISVQTTAGKQDLPIGSDGAFIGVFPAGPLTATPVSYTLDNGRTLQFGWGDGETMVRR